MITFCLSTYNNLEYLKLAIKSVRENSFFKEAPFIVHAENCTDGTNEWLVNAKDAYGLDIYIESGNSTFRGIGGGMNFCADKVITEYIIFLQSDFYVSRNFDLGLINTISKIDSKALVSSWRVQPDIFRDCIRSGTIFVPLNAFGDSYKNFKECDFLNWSDELSEMNDVRIRRAEGAGGYIIKKTDWDYIGGNDSLFAPVSYEDMDLFIRMQLEGFTFVQTSSSIIWHFAGRGSHRLEENSGKSSERQISTEAINLKKWMDKWGEKPTFDEHGFILPIKNTRVKTRITYDIINNTSY